MKVFLSYSKSDENLAESVAKVLREDGFDPWLDSDISPGENWAAAISEALENSQAMVVLISKDWLHSQWARRDLEFAMSHPNYRGRLFPVVIGKADQDEHAFPWFLKNISLYRLQGPEATDEELHGISRRLSEAA